MGGLSFSSMVRNLSDQENIHSTPPGEPRDISTPSVNYSDCGLTMCVHSPAYVPQGKWKENGPSWLADSNTDCLGCDSENTLSLNSMACFHRTKGGSLQVV